MKGSLIALLVASAFVLGACGGTEGGANSPSPTSAMDHGMDHGMDQGSVSGDCRGVEEGEVVLVAEALEFDTDCIEADADEAFEIAFENRDGAPHNVRIEDEQGGVVFDGENVTQDSIDYAIPALAAGEYPFHCHIHPDMAGTLIVR